MSQMPFYGQLDLFLLDQMSKYISEFQVTFKPQPFPELLDTLFWDLAPLDVCF